MIKLSTISAFLCNHWEIKEEELFSKSRKRNIVNKRQMFHYLAKKLTNRDLATIGRYYHENVYDHSTVIHSMKVVENFREMEKEYDSTLTWFETELKGIKNATKEVVNPIEKIRDELSFKIERVESFNQLHRLLFEYINVI